MGGEDRSGILAG